MLRYKVVNNFDGTITSYVVGGLAQITYEIGVPARAPEWLARKGLHPFVFATLEDALDFANGIIYLCETTEEMKVDYIYNVDELGDGHIAPSIWEPPSGSLMAKTVTLIREVTQVEIYVARKAARNEVEQ